MKRAQHVVSVRHARGTVLVLGTCMVLSVSSPGKDARLLTDDEDYRDPLHLVVRIDGDPARVTTLVFHLLHEPCLGVDLDSTAPVS